MPFEHSASSLPPHWDHLLLQLWDTLLFEQLSGFAGRGKGDNMRQSPAVSLYMPNRISGSELVGGACAWCGLRTPW